MSYSVSWTDYSHKILDFFRLYFWSYVQLKFENFSRTQLFCSFVIFKRTQGTSIPSNYINFTKTTNQWIVCGMTRPFGN